MSDMALMLAHRRNRSHPEPHVTAMWDGAVGRPRAGAGRGPCRIVVGHRCALRAVGAPDCGR